MCSPGPSSRLADPDRESQPGHSDPVPSCEAGWSARSYLDFTLHVWSQQVGISHLRLMLDRQFSEHLRLPFGACRMPQRGGTMLEHYPPFCQTCHFACRARRPEAACRHLPCCELARNCGLLPAASQILSDAGRRTGIGL